MKRWIVLAIAFGELVGAMPAAARILKTPPNPGHTPRDFPLTIGSGAEYDSDGEQSELGLPMLLELSPLPRLTFTAEQSFVSIHSKPNGSLRGFGDLETSATVGLWPERRHRPATALLGAVKWPTASSRELGTGHADFTAGVLASKSLAQFDAELGASVTWVGRGDDARASMAHDISLAIERDLHPKLDLIGEVVVSRGPALGGSSASGRESEVTLGLAYQWLERLNLEQGIAIKADGGWQLLFGWLWEFGSTD